MSAPLQKLLNCCEAAKWREVPPPEVSRFLDHFVGAFFLAQASRLYKQEAREVLV